jgi:hypothetical protein
LILLVNVRMGSLVPTRATIALGDICAIVGTAGVILLIEGRKSGNK